MKVFFPILAAVALTVLSGCGVSSKSASTSQLTAIGPDLRFASPILEVALPSGGLMPVSQGAQFSIPCNTSGFRGRYKYVNAGGVGAAAHVNRSHTSGSAAYSFAQLPLAAAAVRSAWASFGPVPVPNSATMIAIRLDSTLVVAETLEGNNAWWAKVVRKCP